MHAHAHLVHPLTDSNSDDSQEFSLFLCTFRPSPPLGTVSGPESIQRNTRPRRSGRRPPRRNHTLRLTLTHTPLAREARTRAQFHVACSDLRYRYYNQLILFPPVVLVSLISIRGLSRQVEAKKKVVSALHLWLCAGSACATSRTAERVHLQARNDPAPTHPAVCHPAPRQT